MSCYDSRINETPNIDRIANEGIRFDNCFCTNSICTPSRAAILTGTYNHLNGVKTLGDQFDGRQEHVAKILQRNGYQSSDKSVIISRMLDYLDEEGIADQTIVVYTSDQGF